MNAETPRISGAWIAPDGLFYGCKSYEHIEVEEELARQYYGVHRWDILREMRWIHLHDNGVIGHTDYEFSQAQLDTLWAIIQAEPDSYARLYMQVDKFKAEIRSCFDVPDLSTPLQEPTFGSAIRDGD